MKYILRHLSPRKGKLLLILLLMLIYAVLSGISLTAIMPLVSSIFRVDTQTSGILGNFNRYFLRYTPMQAVTLISGLIVVIFLLRGIVGYAQRYLGAQLEEGIIKEIRDKLYTHIHALPLSYFVKEHSGHLIARATSDVDGIRRGIKDGFLPIIRETMLILVYSGIAIYLSPMLFLYTVAIFLPIFFIIQRLGMKLRHESERVQNRMAKVTRALSETFGGIKVIKAYAAEAEDKRRFDKLTFAHMRTMLEFERLSLIGTPLAEFMFALAIAVMLILGAYAIFIKHVLTASEFILFIGAIVALVQPVRNVAQANSLLQRAINVTDRVYRVMELPCERTHGGIPLGELKECIVFDNVHFAYDTEYVLMGVSFSIHKGEKIAIIGTSGVGKTTIVDLLLGFYEPTYGRIIVDGHDLREIDLRSWRKHIGVVTQEPILFNTTIIENIALGEPTVDIKRVKRAAMLAHADEFISKLPDGYNTIIGERGVTLSGGERQRLALARAIYKEPEILILDEVTAYLDRESAQKIEAALEEVLKGRTALIITHDESTLKLVDRVLELRNGRIYNL